MYLCTLCLLLQVAVPRYGCMCVLVWCTCTVYLYSVSTHELVSRTPGVSVPWSLWLQYCTTPLCVVLMPTYIHTHYCGSQSQIWSSPCDFTYHSLFSVFTGMYHIVEIFHERNFPKAISYLCITVVCQEDKVTVSSMYHKHRRKLKFADIIFSNKSRYCNWWKFSPGNVSGYTVLPSTLVNRKFDGTSLQTAVIGACYSGLFSLAV